MNIEHTLDAQVLIVRWQFGREEAVVGRWRMLLRGRAVGLFVQETPLCCMCEMTKRRNRKIEIWFKKINHEGVVGSEEPLQPAHERM